MDKEWLVDKYTINLVVIQVNVLNSIINLIFKLKAYHSINSNGSCQNSFEEFFHYNIQSLDS